MKQFNLFWGSGALAGGVTNVNNINTVTILNNLTLRLKTLTVQVERVSSLGTIIQSGSCRVRLEEANDGIIDEKLIFQIIGTEFASPLLLTLFTTPDCPQLFTEGLNLTNGSDLELNFVAFNFGTTALNDEVRVYFLIGYEDE